MLSVYNSSSHHNSLPDAPNALIKLLHTNGPKLQASFTQHSVTKTQIHSHCAIPAVWLGVKKIQLCVYSILFIKKKGVRAAALFRDFVILTAIVYGATIHCSQIFSPTE